MDLVCKVVQRLDVALLATTFLHLLAASARVLKAAALDAPTAARALGVLLLLLCGAVSVWRWGARRRSLCAHRSPQGSKPGVAHGAGTIASHPHLAQDSRMHTCLGFLDTGVQLSRQGQFLVHKSSHDCACV